MAEEEVVAAAAAEPGGPSSKFADIQRLLADGCFPPSFCSIQRKNLKRYAQKFVLDGGQPPPSPHPKQPPHSVCVWGGGGVLTGILPPPGVCEVVLGCGGLQVVCVCVRGVMLPAVGFCRCGVGVFVGFGVRGTAGMRRVALKCLLPAHPQAAASTTWGPRRRRSAR